MRILVDAQFIKGGKEFAAHVATVGHFAFMCLGVFQEGIQLLEGLVARAQDALVDLKCTPDMGQHTGQRSLKKGISPVLICAAPCVT